MANTSYSHAKESWTFYNCCSIVGIISEIDEFNKKTYPYITPDSGVNHPYFPVIEEQNHPKGDFS
jgi:hypothetical protein